MKVPWNFDWWFSTSSMPLRWLPSAPQVRQELLARTPDAGGMALGDPEPGATRGFVEWEVDADGLVMLILLLDPVSPR